MLNLDNVDSPEAWKYPLVLTSPRSLAACRLVGVKPVELLPKDIMELAVTVGTCDLDKLADLRDHLEHRRLTKLEHCRAIRQYLISQHAIDEHHLLTNYKYKNECRNLPPKSPTPAPSCQSNTPNRFSVSFRHRNRNDHCLDRKERLDMENRAVADDRKIAPQTQHKIEPCHDRLHVKPCSKVPPPSRPVFTDCFGRTFLQNPSENEQPWPPRSQSRQRHTRFDFDNRSSHRSDTPCLLSSSSERVRIVDPYPSPSSTGRTSQSSKKIPTHEKELKGDATKAISEKRSNGDRPLEELEDTSQSVLASEQFSETPKTSSSIRPLSANISDFGRTLTPRDMHRRLEGRKRSNGRRRARSLSATRRLQQSPALSFGGNKCSSEMGYRERGSKCLSQQIRRSTPQYLACRNKIAELGTQWRRTADAVGLSEEDQKILRLLERKTLEKRALEMTAEAARILWEKEEQQRTKQQEWEKERRKLEIDERRKADKVETKRRLAFLEKNFNRAQRRLAETLRRRDEEAQQRLAKIALQKDAMRAEKKAADLARQASVEKRLKHLNQEMKRYQAFREEELETGMHSAKGRREWYSSTAMERRKMTCASLLVLPSPPECSLRKRPSSAPKLASATSDPRIASARMVRDAIDRNLAASRALSAVQSEAAARAAASRASARIKARSTRVRVTSTRRRVAHLASAARLRAMRGAAVARLRSKIRAGERKIAAILAAKERSVESSRAAAAVAAQLRQNLRGTLSPTTFDRMAADVQNILRIPSGSRVWTTDHRSLTHIKLG